jgi:hypothetical protein
MVVPNPVWRPGQLPAGTWCREIGPMRYVLTARDGHLTITMTMAEEAAGKTVTQGYTLTADCYPTRDGGGLVGLFTGLDAVCDGPDAGAPDAEGLLESVVKLQQALADKPFALTFRVGDDALMIGNLRLPAADRDTQGVMEPLAAMAGRYKLATGPLPKAKPAKVTAVSGMTLPSPRHLEHYPQYVPPDPAFPLPRELQGATDPDRVAPAPRPVAAAVTPMMPPPEPLPVRVR